MHIDHVAIWARDLEGVSRFYETYFGGRCERAFVDESISFASRVLIFDEGAKMELMSMPTIPVTLDSPETQATGLIHLAFTARSRSHVDDLTARIGNDGFRIVDVPWETPDGFYESCVLDPEGNRVEISHKLATG